MIRARRIRRPGQGLQLSDPAKSLVRGLVLLLFGSIPLSLWAQTSNGTLVGSVLDPAGAVLPRAQISAVSPLYGQPHETQTDSAGTYRMESLQPGTYTVTISAQGFDKLTVAGVDIEGSLTTTINGRLKLATTQQSVQVQANAAMAIDTQSGQLGESVSRQELVNLPFEWFQGALNPTLLVLTLPGVQDSPVGKGAIVQDASVEGVGFSVNGARPQSNNFLIDGQDDNDYALTGQAFQPVNYGAIQEVAVLTNAYSAEYGRGGGSVTNYILKSGTNNFHGDLWEVNRNSALAAIPAQDAVVNPISKNPYDNDNTFGFDAGGPVLKNKLFAFGAVQWRRERSLSGGPNGEFLPTENGITTLESLEPSYPNISLLLSAIAPYVGAPGTVANPDPMIPLGKDSHGVDRGSVEIGRFQLQNVHTVLNNYDWNYRMDWQFTDRDVLTGSVLRDRFTLSPDTFGNFGALPQFDTQQNLPTEIFRGQWAHTLSSSLISELRLSYTNLNINFDPTAATLAGPLANMPYISFGTDIEFPSIGVRTGFPQDRNHTAWQVQEALSHSLNRHTIKAGVDVTILSLQDGLGLDTRGSILYNFNNPTGSASAYTSLGNFLDDTTGQDPGTYEKQFGTSNLHSTATMFAPYLEDTWRATSDLTLTMGLRYEYWGALANALAFPAFNTAAGIGLPNAVDPSYSTDLATFESLFTRQNPDKRNFAPRFGAAYAPRWGNHWFADGRTVIRAGYGIFYDGLYTEISDSSAMSQPNTLGGMAPTQSGRGTGAVSTFPGISSTTPDTTLLIQTMAGNLHNPLIQQWNLDVQRELRLGLVLTLAYVGTRGEHLFANSEFNPEVFYTRANPNFGEFEVRTNAGDSWYNSGQLEIERKFHSLVLRAAYTYSKFLDDTSGTEITTGGSTFPQILSDQHSDWGPSAYDRRHRLSILYAWPVPYFHDNAFLRALTDQWQWSGLATIESGTPNTAEVGTDVIGNGHLNSRPNLANPNAPLNAFAFDGGFMGSPYFKGSDYAYGCVLDWYFGGPVCPPELASNFHFIIPALGVPGDVGRNTLFGPGQVYFDTAIQRDFPVHFWKRENQTFSFRVDLFDALNHSNLFTPDYTMFDPNFGNTAITIQGGRQIKLWLKYSF